MLQDLVDALASQPIETFSALLRRRLSQLAVCALDRRVIPRAEADALIAQALELALRAVHDTLADRPGDALRLIDAVRGAGFDGLDGERDRLERACAARFPPPPPVTWRELGELRLLAAHEPAVCRIGPPVAHVEFAARLAATGVELPSELLGLYAAVGHIELSCRAVAVPAGGICAGDALRVRDGRVVLFDRLRRHPAMMLIEQPGVSITQALGTWWLVLEDEHAPALRRPLDLQGLLRFALLRVEASSRELLLTDLAWRRFFA